MPRATGWLRGPAGPSIVRPAPLLHVLAGDVVHLVRVHRCQSWLGHGQPAGGAGRASSDCLPGLSVVGWLVRVRALARVTSGSRGLGRRTSCLGRSRRARGRRSRICCTFLISLAGRPFLATAAGRPGLWWAWLWGNGRNPRRGGASPEGGDRVEYRYAAGPHTTVLPIRPGGQRQGIRPSRRPGAAASMRLAAPSWLRACVTCF